MQTEINYNQVYSKIYHHTTNLLVHYLVSKNQECISQCCWHDFVIKDVAVKQVTSNVTYTDKINIVSSQAVLGMSSFSMDTRSMSSSPLVNSLVKNRLFKTAPDIDERPFQFIHTMDLSVVDTMLHDSPDIVIHGMRSVLFGGHSLDAQKFGVSRSGSSTVARVRRGVPVHCPAGRQSHYQTFCVSYIIS